MRSAGAGSEDLRSHSDAEWRARIAALGEAAGAFEALGPRHSALFSDQGAVLLVSFETARAVRAAVPEQLPLAYRIAEGRNWSSLSLIAHDDTWFRDPAVYGYFDRLVDDAFFEDFDQVVFFGAGMCGYAAAAFSVTAPGATAILCQPQATLDPAFAGWDPRFAESRRLNFSDRYGFAPDMTEGAGPVFVIYDPEQTLDAMHAALFRRPHVTMLPCRHIGRDSAAALDAMHILPSILTAACSGIFDAAMFRTFWRSRRNHVPYLRNLMGKLDTDGRPLLNAILCRNVVQRLNEARFRTRLAELEAQLDRAGLRLPQTKVGAFRR
jgi:hypothetical protein